MRPSFFHHLHPPTIPAMQARWRHTLGAGGTAVFLMLVLGATGILEMFYYSPHPSEAARSVQTIAFLVPFGWLIRNLHYWSAQMLILFSAIHLLRVIFTAAYSHPRRFNYLLGMGLFVFATLLDFTGYVLRWDVNVRYRLLTGTNLLKIIPLIGSSLFHMATGGNEIGAATLLHFYVLHIFGLTSIALVLMVWHVFRVRRDGGIAVPPSNIRAESECISRNEMVQREVLAMFAASIFLIMLSVFLPAPIAPAMTEHPTVTDDTLAPWFFLWIQQMLKWGDPFLFGVLIPFALLMVLAFIPYLFPKINKNEIGSWFPKSNRLAQFTVGIISLVIIALTLVANAN